MNEQSGADLPLSPHRPLAEYYQAPAARQDFINHLFDEAAPDYDWVSNLMSSEATSFTVGTPSRKPGWRRGCGCWMWQPARG
jgi:hypothetical protein